ncbi:BamA/TamA family outer membrane protein [Leptolyngbya cf. ectocarpi LEGE 11479]|uniref:BamA/TamA family outer membrane protein n=1 Tax=Leptolyngbya cf. ectocarpi LEGE 11479 TaxID=1828722 RepID=A0A928ZX90_LEPEC|nr:BamA/TamA family outer membrane protein [Leptolyngbya ectocarpi]MBE9069119.1 BamA/TamA family outer membrane protein [Leptolyngbya cf. ectocarpi LEGE 11479]
MRFSPTLLACCTVATLFGLPVLAADATDVVETSTAEADDAGLTADMAQLVELPSEAETVEAETVEVSPPQQLENSPAPVDDTLLVQDAEIPDETPEEKLERLLEGIGQPARPPEEPDVPPTPEAETPSDATPDEGVAEEEPVEEEIPVLVAELDVVTLDGSALDPDLEDIVYQALTLRPGRTATRSQLQEDINNVFATGFFANVRARPDDTDLGVRVTFGVQPNPILTGVTIRTDADTASVLPDDQVDEIFGEQYGRILNLIDFQDGILELNEWYRSQGYVLAQVTAAPQVSDNGVATLIVAEGVIESIEVRYIDEDGNSVDAEGEPIDGKTRPFIVTRQFRTEPGDVFRQDNIQADLQRVFGLGIFDDVRLSLDPGDEDPRKVKVVVNIDESSTGSVGAAVGFNLRGDVFGSVSYQQDNLGGNDQTLRTEVQLSESDLLFDVSFNDPWIAGDPHHTSYTVNGFNRRSISLIFDGGDTDVDLPNGDTPRVNRLGGGVTFSRPLDDPWDNRGWSGSVGLEYQRVSIRDSDGDLSPEDQLGNELSFSGSGRDDLLSIPIGLVWDQRNNPLAPTSGSLLRLGSEQTIPVGNGTIFFNRVRASYSRYLPVNFVKFGDGPQTIALNVQGGTVIGDLPPYEAFSLGGTNSVRGYDEGDLGSGRSFVQATAEYRFPLFTSFLGGALFVDYGSDLGSGGDVPGDPAIIRGKPGDGFGYGAGVRVQTPLGALRLDYGFGDDGDGRIHFGIGERF